jgi:hypothetical protein
MDVDMHPCTIACSGNMSLMEDVEHSDVRSFDLGPRSPWIWLTTGVTLLGVAETVAVAALVHALLPAWIGYLIDALIVVPTLCLLVAIASALGGRITVDSTHLRLRFGLLGGTQVLRADINHAERFVPSSLRPVGLGLDVPSGSAQATVSRGGQAPFVRVLLDRPTEVRLALWRRESARELVMSTGAPDQLIAALG